MLARTLLSFTPFASVLSLGTSKVRLTVFQWKKHFQQILMIKIIFHLFGSQRGTDTMGFKVAFTENTYSRQ